jgi:hypothetical protein
MFDSDPKGLFLTQLTDSPVLSLPVQNFVKDTSLNKYSIDGESLERRLEGLKGLDSEKQMEEGANLIRKILPLAKGFIQEYRSTIYIST